MAILVSDDKKSTVTQIAILYNEDMKKSTFECTTVRNLMQVG